MGQWFAAHHPDVAFTHIHPGQVSTPTASAMMGWFDAPLGWLLVPLGWLLTGLLNFFRVSQVRVLFFVPISNLNMPPRSKLDFIC
jgi:hypothetical protein